MKERICLKASVSAELAGQRVDRIAASLFPDYSRAMIQGWISEGKLLLDGKSCRAKDKAWQGSEIHVQAEQLPQGDWQAEDLPLDICFEDAHILVLNKPAGIVVHPGAGNREGTLLNALLFHEPTLELLPRAGIVHRLDKDTSGLLVIAKTLKAYHSLVAQLQARSVRREYLALVKGVVDKAGRLEKNIGRHPRQRTRMAVLESGGKEAITHYRIKQRFEDYTLLQVSLETGRTHQIRVHMAYLKHPLVGDPVYGGKQKLPISASPGLLSLLDDFRRQALHATRLALLHPESGETLQWECAMPEDMSALVTALQEQAF